MIVAILGGSGTLGTHVIPILLRDPQVTRIRILSRNEHRHSEMMELFPNERIDYFVGDIRDYDRVYLALYNCSQVFHFAATKRVETCEYNPDEAIKTNVIGTQNIIRACRERGVDKAIFTSTDKAVSPLNLYGITKSLGEKIWIAGNIGSFRTRFSACRYGNVAGSRGSCLMLWKKQVVQKKPITVTSGGMTRYFIHPNHAAEFVVTSMKMMNGGEIFIPKMKGCSIEEIASVVSENRTEIKKRPGEKIHERLIAEDEVELVTDIGDRYVRWPESNLYPILRNGSPIHNVITSQFADRFTRNELEELWQAVQ